MLHDTQTPSSYLYATDAKPVAGAGAFICFVGERIEEKKAA